MRQAGRLRELRRGRCRHPRRPTAGADRDDRDHEHTSRRFAGSDADRFAGALWREQSGGPALDDAVAWLDCDVYAEDAAGDHTPVVAQVRDLGSVDDGRALVFFRGSYGNFSPHEQP
ncbi:flavin reductase family protein [Aeromicrobium wangtongii]|uniref:flavin reductase family protein n=1 Tax=Aeromicrobium wangtongii TaxID=2969247 RepID=UPI002017D5A5|nr:flavin reductase family protein [Aeromicrobium wangtongii]MCL3818281.1 flavin reductase family protein [Aeromicrobium wangtongii]